MPQNTNLNVSPYFDDFVDSKNYHKVLFKPGFPVQARELTTLQSILQNQVEKFGQHFFKEGSMVIPGGTTYDDEYFSVKIDPNFLNIPVSNYTKVLVDNAIRIKGETSGAEAVVVNRITSSESIDGFDTLYVKYTKSGEDGVTSTFLDGENLITLSNINYLNTSITADSQFARCIVSNATSVGSAFSVSEGIYFIRGFFVTNATSTIILDQYTNEPSYRVGFLIKEETIGPSSVNSDLYDNAKGFSNESAPGADRFKLSTVLHKKLLTDTNDGDFVELLRIENGLVKSIVSRTDYNKLSDEFARRTYDESGDYYVKPFSVSARESLNDRIGNRGIYLDTQQTQNGNTPEEDMLTLQVSSGKAYVKGYEVEKISTSSLDVLKPRTTKLVENQSVPIRIGNSIQVTNIKGTPSIGFDANAKISLRDRRLGLNQAAAGTVIGDARVFDYSKTLVGTSASLSTYDLKVYDVQLYTVLTTANSFSTPIHSHVKGKFSGSVGYAVAIVNNATSVTLRDVTGLFQINEPLIINGVESGNNIVSATDNSFEDVKGVSSSGFTADTVLDRTKRVFNEGVEFSISGTTMTAAGIADFRSQLKAGDIITYPLPTFADPNFNTVTAVTADSVTLAANQTITGICTGAVTASSPTGVNVVIPTLKESDDPGFRVKLTDKYIASMNVLDSSYITRKQITKSFSNRVATFNIDSDLSGDTSNLFLEPFSESNYVLELDDVVEKLLAPMVVVNANLKTVTISGLSDVSGTATLTVSVRRSKLVSKEKSLTRCNSLTINRSALTGSGTASSTFEDGLTSSSVYGTRVQDEEISLNVPEVTRVLAVFESNDSTNPDLPLIGVTNQTTTFSGNVTVGEQFVGGTSGAVARVVVVQATQLSFVYENDKVFQVGENISLKTSGIFATITGVTPGDRNILKNFDLDNGQRVEFADFSRLVRKPNVEKPTRKLTIIFDNLVNDEISGNVETVNSYNTLDYSKDIPYVFDDYASDFIDFRPRVAAYNTGSSISPFSFASRDFSSTNSESVVSGKTVVVDYSYYQGRIDRLYLTTDGLFITKDGAPSRFPKAPLQDEGAFQVATIKLPPYIRNAQSEVLVKTVPHKRFTMRDIGSLENRIKNLENYTTLSLLETDTKNLSVKDPNTGLDKFKSGFFVDNFRNHNSHNLTGESKFDIDIEKSELRPRSTERNVGLVFETVTTQANPTTTDYNFVDDFTDGNITRGGAALTLKYEEENFINQPFATRTENVNPFMVDTFVGSIELLPNSDFWIEETPLTPQTVEIDNAFDAIATMLGVEDRENGGMASSFWNSTEITWNGRDSATLVDEERIGRDVINRDVTVTRNGRTTTTTTVTDFRNTIRQTFEESGTEREFGLELSAHQEVVDLGTKVVGIDVLYNVRSRNVQVTVKRVRPNTRFFVFMENTDLTEYAVPKYLPITMKRGTFKAGEIVETSVALTVLGAPKIKCRVAEPDHKRGEFNNPLSETYEGIDRCILPDIGEIILPTAYSSTSQVLNIDTADLGLQNNIDHVGYVTKGMHLVNSSGTAECEVGDLGLFSDAFGDLIFSLHIPDPRVKGNPLFTTGNNTIRVTTSPTNAIILDPGSSSAEAEYLASGYSTSTQEQALSIKTPKVERIQTGSDQVTREFTRDRTEVTQSTTTRTQRRGRRNRRTPSRRGGGVGRNPLAQSFFVERGEFPDGIFITSGEMYFKTKDDKLPVDIQVRTVRDGTPTLEIVPFGETQIEASDVKLSDDGSVATPFKFPSPVYLQGGYEYCLVFRAPNTPNYLCFINRIGESDLIDGGLNSGQPVVGSLFKSQNNSTWTPSQYEDLKFKLNKANFVTNTPSSILLYNSELPNGEIQKENPVVSFSKRVSINLSSTTSATITQGEQVTQTSATGVVNTGKVFATGGPLATGASKLSIVRDDAGISGIGLTTGTFPNVSVTALTGSGTGAVVQVVVNTSASSIVADSGVTVTTAGSGYAAGDLLLLGNVGFTGSGIRAVVKSASSINNTDLIVLDNVKDTFVNNRDIVHTTGGGTATTIANADIATVNPDPIRDGYTLQFDHKNHGMHSSTNKVRVSNFHPDGAPTVLTNNIDDDSTTISLSSGTNFTTFEGGAVGVGTSGYLLIDKEIISYNTISGNTITIDGTDRGIDSSLKSNHAANTLVYKYEFNGVSLRKINKEHDIDPRERTFDSYFIKVSDTDTEPSFVTTKSGGGSAVFVSQNIPFEAINPQITSITPTGTNISGRIKTTSGTSLSGNEASFSDKGYESVALNKLNYLDDPRMIASKPNEYNLLSNQKSFALELTLSTDNKDVSPVVDLENPNIIAVSNLVDNKVDDFETDSRPKIPGSDPNTAIYETKMINLEFVSNSLLVQFDGHREAEGDIRVFYKLIRGDGDDDHSTYIPFNTNGLPDKVVNPNKGRDAFSEYKFTAENTAQFKSFMIKVVMTSTNQAKPPRIKNFRSIALRSFQIE